MKSQIRHSFWSVQRSTDPRTLTSIVDKCFNWPNGLAANIRESLKLEAPKALIKMSIVRIPMVFSTRNTIVVPPMLVERQNDLRRLAVNLNDMPYDGQYNRELNKSIKEHTFPGRTLPNSCRLLEPHRDKSPRPGHVISPQSYAD